MEIVGSIDLTYYCSKGGPELVERPPNKPDMTDRTWPIARMPLHSLPREVSAVQPTVFFSGKVYIRKNLLII